MSREVEFATARPMPHESIDSPIRAAPSTAARPAQAGAGRPPPAQEPQIIGFRKLVSSPGPAISSSPGTALDLAPGWEHVPSGFCVPIIPLSAAAPRRLNGFGGSIEFRQVGRISEGHTDSNPATEALPPEPISSQVRPRAAEELSRVNPRPAAIPPAPKPSPSAAVAEYLAGGGAFRTIVEARKFVGRVCDHSLTAKRLDETVELGVVKAARAVVDRGLPARETYAALVDLYGRQPRLTARTSTSIAEQAYSTPAPLAYLASILADVSHETSVYEPAAGNGMLLICADPAKVAANEINADRRAALAGQGFRVTEADASISHAHSDWSADVVIANPPFGSVRDAGGQSRVFDFGYLQPGYRTHEIDHAIALHALDTMRNDGRAVLILGGANKLAGTDDKRSDAYNGKAKREFYKVLMDNYRVTDHFSIAGELYERQGAGWPVDVVVIAGRGKSDLPLPAVRPPPLFGSWEELACKLDGPPPVPPMPPEDSEEPVAEEKGVLNMHTLGSAPPEDSEEAVAETGAPIPLIPAGIAQPQSETEAQVAYQPRSRMLSLRMLVPRNMGTATHEALARVERERGPLDAYVAESLRMSEDEMSTCFGAEQVDTIALAIHNIERGDGFICGHQTGVGKGRIIAGIIRYAMVTDKTPIFVTAGRMLYKDIYRDLSDTKIQRFLGREIRMLMTDVGTKVPLDDAQTVFVESPALNEHNAYLRSITKGGAGLPDHDLLLTTYSQMQTVAGKETVRRRMIRTLAPNAIIAFDEAHQAGGVENKRANKNAPPDRAAYAREIVRDAFGVLYSSATYAKKPGVMSLYSRTGMSKAVSKPADLAPALERGGVPMQQAVAATLVRAGQYVRCEQSFAGISYSPCGAAVDHDAYAAVAKALATINDFSRIVRGATKIISNDLKATAEIVGADAAVGEAGVRSLNFTSVMHNLVDQMLLSMKAPVVVREAAAALERGEKVVLTFANTMESFINQFAELNDVSVGDPMDMRFNDLLQRYLDRTRTISIRKPFTAAGEKAEKHVLTDEELGPAGRASYARGRALIAGIELGDMPISPVDYIRHELHRAGYRVAEITGRQGRIDYSTRVPTYARRGSREIGPRGRIRAVSDFNSGLVDVLLLNRAGATGISAHSSAAFADQRPRHMILVQAEANVDQHMQVLGRVNRVGQVVLPAYTQLIADVPAETRPASNLLRKMGSLCASTTAARGHALSLGEHVPDFLNKYGDVVAFAVMRENPELNRELDDPVDLDDGEGNAGAMRKLTGRIPLLPPKTQARLYEALTSEYKSYIAELEASGESPMEARRLDLDAVTLKSTEVRAGSGDGPFECPVVLETLDVRRVGRPYASGNLVGDAGAGAGARDAWIEHYRVADTAGEARAMAIAAEKGEERARERTGVALADFAAFLKMYLADLGQDSKYQQVAARLDANEARFRSLAALFFPGGRITVKLPDENLSGVVTRFARAGDAQNPLALGSWRVDFAVPGRGRLQYSLTRLYAGARPGASGDTLGASGDTLYEVQPGYDEGWETVLAAFDQLAAQAREQRMMLTGNLLAAYDWIRHRGQIVNYTDRAGAVRQGILMPAAWCDERAVLRQATGVPMTTATEVLAHLASTRTALVSVDGAVSLGPARDGGLTIAVPAAKGDGGRYYLDAGVRGALNYQSEFYRRGALMRAEIRAWRLESDGEKIVGALMRAGAVFERPIDLPEKEQKMAAE